MLPPDARTVLSDALRPPPGAALDRAVALTFTLDLNSALTVPLAFAAHSIRETSDPLTVMEAVRRCADRVDIFCQAGQIAVPSTASDLHAFLEQMVHPVRRPRPGRLFHPKLWAVRYWDATTETYPARLLALSRNLTADRSWDVCLRLDGTVTTAPAASNKPLVDLVRHAMSLADRLTDERRVGLDELAEDLRRVEWELPDGVEEVAFHAFGVSTPARPDFNGSQHLVVSPFCTEKGLERVLLGGDAAVVGRQEELDRLPDASLTEHQVYVVNELAGLPADDAESAGSILTGLHAKLYVIEQGWRARVFLGSANATDAAFDGNTELLVELIGRRTKLGIATMLADGAGFKTILEPYNRQPAVDRDTEQWQLENFLRDAASVPLTATAEAAGQSYRLRVTSEAELPGMCDVRLTAELLTRRGEAVVLRPGAAMAATFDKLSVVDVTPFMALTARDGSGNQASTVVRCTLVGDPPGRLDEILARQVDTPEKFLQFLSLLLGLGGDYFAAAAGAAKGGSGRWAGVTAPGVLELVMRGLVDQPKQLEDLARIVTRLTANGRSRELLPDGFAELWTEVDKVRRELIAEEGA